MRLLGNLIAGAIVLGLAACQTPETRFSVRNPDGTVTSPGPGIPAEDVRFALEPFKGAPGNIADDISRRIALVAEREGGLSLSRRNTTDITHRMVGNLAATGDASRGILVYVFDIFDRSGARVYRFTGQEVIGPADGDPWEGVDDESISNLAERTVRSLDAWLNGTPSM